jgi:hypothetical protein
MKKVIVIGCVLLIFNVLLGMMLSKYALFNMCLNSIVIIVTTASITLLDRTNLSTAYKISLSFIFGSIGIIEYICGFFSKCTVTDNWVIITDLILLVIQLLILIVTTTVTSKVNN